MRRPNTCIECWYWEVIIFLEIERCSGGYVTLLFVEHYWYFRRYYNSKFGIHRLQILDQCRLSNQNVICQRQSQNIRKSNKNFKGYSTVFRTMVKPTQNYFLKSTFVCDTKYQSFDRYLQSSRMFPEHFWRIL